jgi:hypothetical protein
MTKTNKTATKVVLTVVLGLLHSSLLAGVVFFYTNVNINDGTLSLMRVTPTGEFELIEVLSIGNNLGQVTNHTASAGLPMGKIKREVQGLMQTDWLVDGIMPKRNGQYSIDTGNLPNLLMCTWSDSTVEIRPLNQYTNIVNDFRRLQQLAESKTTCTNTGYILTPLYVGSVNDNPVTITDPYGNIYIPDIGKVLTEEQVLNQGGKAAMKIMGYEGHNVTLVTTPMLIRTEGTNTVISTY